MEGGGAKHIFTWTIENFGVCTLKNGVFFESPPFVAESLDQTIWCVQLYPRGRKETTKEYITCCLKRSDDSPGLDEIEIDHTIEAIDVKNKSFKRHQFVNKFKKGQSLGWEEFLKRTMLDRKTSFYHATLIIRVTLKKKLSNTSTLIHNSCWTKMAADHFSFQWYVKLPFSSLFQNKVVSFNKNLQIEVGIEIPEDNIEVRIRRIKGFVKPQLLMCSITLLDLKSEETNTQEFIFKADSPDEDDTWIFPTSLKKSDIFSEKDKFLENDYFILKFDFALVNGQRKDIECRSLDPPSRPKNEFSLMSQEDFYASLKTDLKQAWTNKVHTDVELHADNEVFRAHKVILCARSPVFMTMFNQDMVENQTGEIHISDVDGGTLHSLLEFMYSGDTDIRNCESALKLLLASNKYDMPSLKHKCSSILKSLLSDENVCDILYTADLIQHESLKDSALSHIKENAINVFKSPNWKQLAEKNLYLATNIVCEVSLFLS